MDPLDKTPVVGWVFDDVSWVALGVLMAYTVFRYARTQTVPLAGVLSIAGMSMWWQETYGDWGGYVLYNSHFRQLHWWGHTSYTSPRKLWVFIAGYGWFYAGFFLLIAAAVRWLRGRRPTWNQWAVIVTLSAVAWYAYDLLVEGFATRLGWWSYTKSIGPALHSSQGTFPLLHPILIQIPMAAVFTAIVVRRDADGTLPLDRLTSMVTGGWRRESARLAVWSVAMNVIFAVTVIVPMCLIRGALGPSSSLVP